MHSFLLSHSGCLSCLQSLLRQGLDQPSVVEQEIGHHFPWSAIQALRVLLEPKRPQRGTAHRPTRPNRAGGCLVIPSEGYATGLGQRIDVRAVNLNRC